MVHKFEQLRKYRFIIFLMLLAAVLMFANINNLPLWHDEASTVMLSRNILKFRYPKAWDGKNLALHDINEYTTGYAFSNNTWLHYYICAVSIALFGQSNLAARLPFVLCGVTTVFMIWKISLLIYKKLSTANLTAALLTVYVPFLLYAKQARYYSTSMLLIASSVYLYLLLVEDWLNERKKLTWLIISLFLLLLSDILSFAVLIGAIILHLIYIRKLFNLKIIIPMAVVATLILISYLFLSEQYPISRSILVRFLVAFWKIQVYFIPTLSLVIILMIISVIHYLFKREQFKLFCSNSFLFPLLILSNIMLVMIPEQNIMNHYFLGVVVAVPFILTTVFEYSKQISKLIAILLLLLVVTSNILNVAPYYMIKADEYEPKMAIQEAKAGRPHLTPYKQYDLLYYTSDNKLYSDLPGPILSGLIASPYTMADCLILPLYQYCNEKLSNESYVYNYIKEITGEYINAPMEITNLLQKYGNSSEKVFINTIEFEYIMLYTNMQVVNRFKFDNDNELARLTIVSDEEIDWFIVTDEKYVVGLSDPEYLVKNQKLFTQYTISTKDILNTPDLDLHLFETTYEGQEIIILHRKP